MKNRLLVALALLPTALVPALAYAYSEPKAVGPFMNAQETLASRCFAGTRIEDTKALGGFGSSTNLPRPVGQMKMQRAQMYLQAKPEQAVPLYKGFKGMTLLLVNPTGASKTFDACDSRLYIVQEALDKQGRWTPIEFPPSSTCGNSYHRVFLGPREYWSFAVPRYTGTYKTKMRFRLSEGKTSVLSNEFEGSVNPGQFKAPKK